MASKYDSLIQNEGVNGLQRVLEAIVLLSQGGSVDSLRLGDVQPALKKDLKLAPNRSRLVIECFSEAGLFGFDEDTRRISITDAMPWGYDDGEQRRSIMISKLQTLGVLEASESDVVEATQPSTPAVQTDPEPAPHAEQAGDDNRAQTVDEPALEAPDQREEQDELPPPPSGSRSSDETPKTQASETTVVPPVQGNVRGRRLVVPAAGAALSAEEMLKQAGLTEGGTAAAAPTTPPAPVQPPPPPRPAPQTPPVAQPGDAPTTAEPEVKRSVWGKKPPEQTTTGASSVNRRPGAVPPPPPVGGGGGRTARRPGAAPPAGQGVPGWQARRGGAAYGQPTSNATPVGMSDDLLRALLNQQKTDLSLDLKTLRALAEEINRYLAGLQTTDLADDPSLRVELQSLLEQINQRAQEPPSKDDSSDET